MHFLQCKYCKKYDYMSETIPNFLPINPKETNTILRGYSG
jgi:hypothetical protein